MSDKIFHNTIYIYNAVVVAVIVVICFFAIDQVINRDQPETTVSTWESGHCKIGEFEIGRSVNIHESNAGMYSYTLIPRADGIVEIWKDRPCDASGGTQ